ncbi:hypothetical protein ACH4A8_29175 [Streptomyces vietnamensis]|uniref:hypothetical protein n=1 Tax=Streptomyces vietnamensis TaxID=362257 RepID=UPI00378BE1BE
MLRVIDCEPPSATAQPASPLGAAADDDRGGHDAVFTGGTPGSGRSGRREVDRLITVGRNVQAILVMRECTDGPKPGIHECVDLLERRFTALRRASDER